MGAENISQIVVVEKELRLMGVAVAFLEVWLWACDGGQKTGFFEFFIYN